MPAEGKPLASSLPVRGDVIAGLRIKRKAGEGGLAVVYEAIDPAGISTAIKVLRPERATDERVVSSFIAEGKATASVEHECVVTVYGEGFDAGYYYILMEFVDGMSLHEYLRRKKRVAWTQAAKIMIQVARGLEAAHAKGFVHRDIKPGNILLFSDGRARLTDFGIVKDISSLKGFLLKGSGFATAAYASPEQCQGKRLDHSTDMYSLGATFYHCVCGQYPHTGDGPKQIMAGHVHRDLTPPVDIQPDLPKTLSNLIERMMAKRQTARYPSMDPMIRELEIILDGRVPIMESKSRMDAMPRPPKKVKLRKRSKFRLPKLSPDTLILIAVAVAVAVVLVLMFSR